MLNKRGRSEEFLVESGFGLVFPQVGSWMPQRRQKSVSLVGSCGQLRRRR